MTSEPLEPAGGRSGDADDDQELGAPITELRGLLLSVDERFVQRVHNGIDRRLLAGSFLDLAWSGPLLVLLELLRIPFELLSGKGRSR